VAVHLKDLDNEDIALVVTHPAQLEYVEIVTDLITELRKCNSASEYNDFQRESLFKALYAAEQHRGQVKRCLKRTERGRDLPDEVPLLPKGDDPNDPATWRIEEIVWSRICRQLRAVGDALGWRASGFNRMLFVIGSSNQPSGPMVDKEGLAWEIGALEEIYAQTSNFVLLNDLTSSMRIGDLTQLPLNGKPWLHEIKKNLKNAKSGQNRRMREAVAAAMENGPLPGQPGSGLIEASRQCRTHLAMLKDAAELANERGVAGMRVPGGRALVVASIPTMLEKQGDKSWHDFLVRERRRILRRAGVEDAPDHLSLRTREAAGGAAPRNAPFGCYPLPPRDCALLICDFLVVEVVFAPEELVGTFARHGIDAQVILNSVGNSVGPQEPVYLLGRRGRQLTARLGGLNEYLLELLHADSFAEAMVDLLDHPNPPAHPVFLYANWARVWK
jgi:hypothetical protein